MILIAESSHWKPDSLQLRIEAALKKKTEEEMEKTDADPDQADADQTNTDQTDADQTDTDQADATIITASVEINHTTEETKNDNDEEKKQSANVEFDIQQDLSANMQLMVDVEKTDTDGANVEFAATDRSNGSFMVMLEETSPSPPPDLSNSIMLEGKYRNDSIIPTQIDRAMQHLLEKASQNGAITANCC